MDTDAKRAMAGIFVLLSIIAFISFSIWFLVNGGFQEPWQQLFSFIKDTEIKPQPPFWKVWNIVFGFVLLDFWLSIVIILFLHLITRKKLDSNLGAWKRLLDLPPLLLFYRLLGMVAAEEIVFRWFPFAILFPIWGTNFALWVVIIVSSFIFGLLHVFNQKPGERNIIYTFTQMTGGVILSYIFLAFDLAGAIAVHLIFDAILIVFIFVLYRIYPESLSKDRAAR